MPNAYQWSQWELGSPDNYMEWIYRLVKQIAPKRVLEIGLGPGGSTVATLLATNDIGSEVITVDIEPLGDTRRKVLSITKADDRWTPIAYSSSKIVPYLPGEFDYIYIDGDHSTEYVQADAEHCGNKLKVGGYLVFDDCGLYSSVNEGIRRWRESFTNYTESDFDFGVINFNGPRTFRKVK